MKPSKFEREYAAAGWDPNFPSSDECIQATARPEMPDHLSELDKLGIHWLHIDLVILARFPTAYANEGRPGEVERTDLLHAIRASGRDMHALTDDEAREIHATLGPWLRDRLEPSERRLVAAHKAGLSEEEIFLHRLDYEPALTRVLLERELELFDYEGNLEAVRQGLKRGELRGELDPKSRHALRRDIRELRVAHEDVGNLLPVLTAKNPGQHLFEVKGGKFRLDATRVRDAMESVVSPVEPVHEALPSQVLDAAAQSPIDEGTTPAQTVEDAERLVILRQELQSMRDSAAAGSPEIVLLENIGRLNSGEISLRRLAEESGFSDDKLRRVSLAIQAELRKRIPPLEP